LTRPGSGTGNASHLVAGSYPTAAASGVPQGLGWLCSCVRCYWDRFSFMTEPTVRLTSEVK